MLFGWEMTYARDGCIITDYAMYTRGPVNEQALAHYEDVIDTCIEYRVEPIVTLYHWDLPLYLQVVYGGWLSEQIVPDFVVYAKVVFERYGSKVPKWVTVNEPIGKWLPWVFPQYGYLRRPILT